MIRPLMFLACAVVLLAACAPAVHGEAVIMQHRTAEAPQRGSPYPPGVELTVEMTAPDGLALPEEISDRAWFAKWMTPMAPQGFVWLAFDVNPESGKRNVLYVDSDCDGTLSDEQKTAPSPEFGRLGFAEIIFQTGDGPFSYHIIAESTYKPYAYPPGSRTRSLSLGTPVVSVRSGCRYEGEVPLDGSAVKVALYDDTVNGVFNDPVGADGRADRLLMTVDGVTQAFFAGKYVEIRGRLYRADIAASGRSVEFAPAEDAPMGSLEVAEGITKIVLAGDNGLFARETSGGAAVRIPAGEYVLRGWSQTATDESGQVWTMEGEGGFGAPGIVVTAGEKTSINTIVPEAGVEWTMETGGKDPQCGFETELLGPMQEKVSLLRGGSPAPPPTLTFGNADGSYRHAVTLKSIKYTKFGGWCPAPVGPEGPYVAEIDYGAPFEINGGKVEIKEDE